MYTVAVRREFIAQHFLIGGDWGAENDLHSHHYIIQLELQGATLDQHQYLADIVDIESNLEELVDYYKDRTLNELPEFQNESGPVNPSIERLAYMICQELAGRIEAPYLSAVTVKIWENDIAWASYRLTLDTA
jgi:6-pyruvoyltetrahydropterin/6-carboxytetrahydropterin synthase